MAKRKAVSVPKFVPFRDDAIAVVMSDAPATVGRIVHYTPGKTVSRSGRQQFWTASMPASSTLSRRHGACCGRTASSAPHTLTP